MAWPGAQGSPGSCSCNYSGGPRQRNVARHCCGSGGEPDLAGGRRVVTGELRGPLLQPFLARESRSAPESVAGNSCAAASADRNSPRAAGRNRGRPISPRRASRCRSLPCRHGSRPQDRARQTWRLEPAQILRRGAGARQQYVEQHLRAGAGLPDRHCAPEARTSASCADVSDYRAEAEAPVRAAPVRPARRHAGPASRAPPRYWRRRQNLRKWHRRGNGWPRRSPRRAAGDRRRARCPRRATPDRIRIRATSIPADRPGCRRRWVAGPQRSCRQGAPVPKAPRGPVRGAETATCPSPCCRESPLRSPVRRACALRAGRNRRLRWWSGNSILHLYAYFCSCSTI